jgi:hypothetical protein
MEHKRTHITQSKGDYRMKPWDNGPLTVTQNRKYLQNGSTPFFWLGDTAWRLFQCLDVNQSRRYLRNRADKGFNVIQAVLLAKITYTETEVNRLPILDADMDAFTSPQNAQYWEHVEAIVEMAREMGLYIALLPVWGNFAKSGFLNEDNAEKYMLFLTERFNKYENIIWLLGGDIRGDGNYAMWDICGKALRRLSPNKLIGYHPFGRTSSSYWFNDCEWLDFNQFQSGHRRYDQFQVKQSVHSWDDNTSAEPWYGEDSWRYVLADHTKTPLRPCLDGEPSYEHIPQGLHDGTQPFWEEHHARRYAWWAVLAGACGHTYGDNSIMQMYGTGTPPAYSVTDTWDVAVHHAGSGHMTFLKNLMEEIDFSACQPLPSILSNDTSEQHDKILTFGNESHHVAYIYKGRDFTISAPHTADAWWYDPASGSRSYIDKIDKTDLTNGHKFTPPVKKYGQNDWVLILKIL